MRIYTGAPVPKGADAIVMVEDSEELSENRVLLHDPGSRSFIRRAGSDVRRGDVALRSGDAIRAGEIGLLALCVVGWLALSFAAQALVTRLSGRPS